MQLVLDVAQLLGRQLIVEDDHAYLAVVVFLVLDILVYLLQLALAHVGCLVGAAHLLGEPLHDNGAGGIGEKFQLVEISCRLGLVLRRSHQSHEDGGLRLAGLGLGVFKFLH